MDGKRVARGVLELSALKTGSKGRRTLELTPEVIELLQGHRALGPMATGLQAGVTVRTEDTPSHHVRFHSRRVSPYDDHSGVPASSGRAPS
jgi:hypothetical protein